MNIVKLDAISSTNSYLKELGRDLALKEDLLVWTEKQTAGRGQMGSGWESEDHKNLTFSVYKRVKVMPINQQFLITMATSLAIMEVLKEEGIANLAVKWPNDILAGNGKLCGILIESVIRRGRLHAVIIGIGLNVNQEQFMYAPRATSMAMETGKTHDLENLLHRLIEQFYKYVDLITNGDFKALRAQYLDNLFKYKRPAAFKDCLGGEIFSGMITGINEQGNLLVEKEDGSTVTFGLKEIELLY
ncbi:MAG: biotin--[acetyl-CoA-carboxylase] ligase [Cytophagaceae bacterium]|nr:biotin--[acetyl-CoA-carboxylase] ligase [Cytophagaceae bacterium]|tara:strand:+ start:4946 stop:5680 length:735 start_codon:yes stop_codon:yes gene_type:complete